MQKIGRLILVIIVGSLIISPFLILYYKTNHQTYREIVVTIKSLDHKIIKGDDTYLVFTEEEGVFQNSDTWTYDKYNSSDIQNKMTVGKKYKIGCYGIRIHRMDGYPNIVSVTPVE
ncbi:MAG: hypothetical protein JWM20_561 [Patescibacteria group bacterium]|nr:hypothetical protein [Patescibacteria group bacterium]